MQKVFVLMADRVKAVVTSGMWDSTGGILRLLTGWVQACSVTLMRTSIPEIVWKKTLASGAGARTCAHSISARGQHISVFCPLQNDVFHQNTSRAQIAQSPPVSGESSKDLSDSFSQGLALAMVWIPHDWTFQGWGCFLAMGISMFSVRALELLPSWFLCDTGFQWFVW